MQTTFTSSDTAAAPRASPPLHNPQSTVPQVHAAASPSGGVAYVPPARLAPRPKGDGAERLSRALGWFSLGLGVTQLLAPRTISRAAGVDDHPGLLRAVGLREIASGVGILSQPKATGWLWSRVAGDAMDLALLGIAATAPGKSGTRRRRVAMVTTAVAGIAALDLLSSLKQMRPAATTSFTPSSPGEVDVEKSITINRSAEECYRFWRDFENFPRFMKHVELVQVLPQTDASAASPNPRSHWRAKGPAGTSIAWDAEITVDQPGELLAWHSLPGADIDNAGTVRFERAPGGRGTVVRVDMHYKPPGGQAGALIAKLFGEEPAQQIDQDLRRFKQLIETGEIPTTVGQSSGPRSMMTRLLFRQGEPG